MNVGHANLESVATPRLVRKTKLLNHRFAVGYGLPALRACAFERSAVSRRSMTQELFFDLSS